MAKKGLNYSHSSNPNRTQKNSHARGCFFVFLLNRSRWNASPRSAHHAGTIVRIDIVAVLHHAVARHFVEIAFHHASAIATTPCALFELAELEARNEYDHEDQDAKNPTKQEVSPATSHTVHLLATHAALAALFLHRAHIALPTCTSLAHTTHIFFSFHIVCEYINDLFPIILLFPVPWYTYIKGRQNNRQPITYNPQRNIPTRV